MIFYLSTNHKDHIIHIVDYNRQHFRYEVTRIPLFFHNILCNRHTKTRTLILRVGAGYSTIKLYAFKQGVWESNPSRSRERAVT